MALTKLQFSTRSTQMYWTAIFYFAKYFLEHMFAIQIENILKLVQWSIQTTRLCYDLAQKSQQPAGWEKHRTDRCCDTWEMPMSSSRRHLADMMISDRCGDIYGPSNLTTFYKVIPWRQLTRHSC